MKPAAILFAITTGLAAVWVTPGCSTLADATAKYGATETTVPYTVDRVGPAAQAVVMGYGLSEFDAAVTRIDATIRGTTAEGKVILVEVTAAGRQTSRIEISNAAGQEVARKMLAEIEARLDAGGPTLSDPREPLPWLAPKKQPPAEGSDGADEATPIIPENFDTADTP